MSLIILYKNASRLNCYIDCNINILSIYNGMTVKEAIQLNRNEDCIIPFSYSSSSIVIPCKLQVKVCDTKGNPCTDAVEGVSPEFYIRTDRGSWNIFHKESVFLIPAEQKQLKIQVSTKERRNIMRAAVAFEFINDLKIIARSDILLVLSKPPIANKLYPFAKTRIATEKDTDCSPSRWIKNNEKYVVIPEMPSKLILPWTVISLGNYRTKPIFIPIIESKQIDDINKSEFIEEPKILKQQRDESEFDLMQQQINEMHKRIKILESEKNGLSKALRLLNENSE